MHGNDFQFSDRCSLRIAINILKLEGERVAESSSSDNADCAFVRSSSRYCSHSSSFCMRAFEIAGPPSRLPFVMSSNNLVCLFGLQILVILLTFSLVGSMVKASATPCVM